MNKIIPLAILAVVTTATATLPASAQGWGYGGRNYNYGANINNVQAQLQARINAGITSGALTQKEASKLQAKLSRIASLEARLRSTGNRLSFQERARLNNELTRLSADIQAQMTDSEIRWNNRNRHRNGRIGQRPGWYR